MLDVKQINKIILDVSYNHKLSHLGSCLQAAPIIAKIYESKKDTERFILSSGHAGLALYAVLQLVTGKPAVEIFEHHGVHPDRCTNCHLDCSTGSLGQGLGIALGMAIADRSKNVYCLISDGECMEGSIWEALRIMNDLEVTNLKVYANLNGFGAYRAIKPFKLAQQLEAFAGRKNINIILSDQLPLSWLQGLPAHYNTMDEKRYKEALETFT